MPKLRRFGWIALLFALACGAEEPAPAPTATPEEPPATTVALRDGRRGMWVLCEGSQRVLDHPDRIPRLIETARELGVTDLFVQVYRGGRAWFASSMADAGPYEEIRSETEIDTLAELLLQAHGAGLEVHAWVNVLSLASNREAPILRELGRDAAMTDRKGRSVLDYPELELPKPDSEYLRMGTPAVWLDPAAPGVTEWLAETFAELVRAYPDLDGLHLDYIRYPDVLPFSPGSRFGVGMDFGYGAPTRARFSQDTGVVAPFGKSLANANRWDDWRRERLTETVQKIRDAAKLAGPKIQLSAAVWPYPERAYLSIFQDWRGWIDDDLLDFAVPMLYTRDNRLLRYEAAAYRGGIGGDKIWIGLGSWLFAREPETAREQLRILRAAGVRNDALFSYDSIVDVPALQAALVEETRGGP